MQFVTIYDVQTFLTFSTFKVLFSLRHNAKRTAPCKEIRLLLQTQDTQKSHAELSKILANK